MAGFIIGTVRAGFGDEDDDDELNADGAVTLVTVGRLPIDPADLTASAIANAWPSQNLCLFKLIIMDHLTHIATLF